VNGGRWGKQHDALASIDLVEEHLSLIAIEVKMANISLVRDEDGRHEIVIAILPGQSKDFGVLRTRHAAD